MSKWEEKKFKEFIKLNRGFDLPNDKMKFGNYPVVASTNIKGYHISYKVTAPVVVTGRSGSLGVVQYINKNCTPLNTTLYVKDFKGNFPRFVYYYLKTMRLDTFNSGAGVPTLNQNHLHSMKINIPDLPTQERIADILSAYDDLIEANNRRIELLEQAAQELYKEWFVRFRFPGHENAKFENGLPEGWKFGKLRDLMHFGAGKTRPEPGSSYPIYGGNGILGYCDYYNNENAIIIGRVGAYCGTVYYEREKCWISDNALYAVSKNNAPFYNYYLLKNMNLNTRQIGTGQPLITQGLLNKLKIIIPLSLLIKRYNAIVFDLLEQQNNLINQNKNLAAQRDLLLPRLMSGKLEM